MAVRSIERPYGWVIVAVSTLCLALGFGANVTVPVLIDPLEKEFGWHRADISFIYTMITIGLAVGGLIWGTLSDRVGVQKIAFLGAFTLSTSLVAVSQQSELLAIQILYLIAGGVGFACLFTPLLALVGSWFDRRKGMAIGIVTAGGAVGQGVVPYVVRLMISEWGWRDAMLWLGIGFFVIMVPLILLLRPPPALQEAEDTVRGPDATLWGLSPSIAIPWLAIAGTFCCLCMAVPVVHLVPLSTDLGFTPETAASIMMTMMVTGVLARLSFGMLADRIGGLNSYLVASFMQTALVFWFTQTKSLPMLYLLAVLFGFGFSGVMTCLIICVREAAPLRMAGRSVAIVTASAWAGMGIGGYQGGYFFDLTGNYAVSYGVAAAAGIVNIGLLLALMSYRRRRTPLPVTA